MKNFIILCLTVFALSGCKEEAKTSSTTGTALSDVEYLHQAQKKLTDIIVTDIFTPPVASRVYVYPLLAAYEAGKFSEQNANSITEQLKGFDKIMLQPGEQKTVTFSINTKLLSYFDETGKQQIEPGTFHIFIGSSSKDVRQASLEMK